MRQSLAFIILLLHSSIYSTKAQDITGRWIGNYKKEITTPHTLEFIINLYQDSLIKGLRTQYYTSGRFEQFSIIGTYNRSERKVFIIEEKPVDQNAVSFGDEGTYELILGTEDKNDVYLKGKWRNSSRGLLTNYSSPVILKKINVTPPDTVASTLPEVDKRTIPLKLKRKEHIIDTLSTPPSETGSIQIEVIDDAKLDHDFISLYINDKLLLNNVELSKEPFTVSFTTERYKTYSVSMVAESTGNLPPCTAYIVIKTVTNNYAYKVESNMSSNGVLIIQTR